MIIGIESSCDDSSISIFSLNKGVLKLWKKNQNKIHSKYGGIVPSLAYEAHLYSFLKIIPNLKNYIKLNNLSIKKIAVTYGPGLYNSLSIGISIGKLLSNIFKVPLVGINHLRAHIFSPFIPLYKKNPEFFKETFYKKLPHLGLIVSGGNTILFKLLKNFSIKVIGVTKDDAAGEALDKGAKLLGLSYPGGPKLEKISLKGNPNKFYFPECMKNENNFSFSGVKTSLKYFLQNIDKNFFYKHFNDICASYQQSIFNALANKIKKEILKENYQSIGLSGGVSSNKMLKLMILNISKEKKIPFYTTIKKYATDNAAMISFASYIDDPQYINIKNSLKANPSLSL